MPTVMDGIIRWRGWLALAAGLLFTPVEARPGLAAIRGGTSAAVIDARGELWVWGALASRLGVPDPRLIEPQPRQVGRPPGVTGWAEALVADLVVARSVEGHLFLLQTEGTARGKALREPQALGPAWTESLHCLRWRQDLPDGTAAVLGVAGLNASGAVELLRCVVPYVKHAEDEPVASVSVGHWVLPFPAGVAAWKEMVAGEGWILARTADGRLFEYLADDPAAAMDDPRPWRPGPELAPGLGWIRLAGVRGDRAAWDSSGELHSWTWSEDPADATTRGRLGLPRRIPRSPSGGSWVAWGGWTTEFHLLNQQGEVWRYSVSSGGLERRPSPRPLRTLESSYSARFGEDDDGRVWVEGAWDDGQLGSFDVSAPEFLPVRGPVAPFHTPGLGPTSVRLSVIRATGSSPVRHDAAGIPAVFQVERFGDLSWPLAVQYRIDSPLAPGRLVVQGAPPIPAQPILSTRTPFLPLEAGVARAEFGVALRFAEGGGATVPVGVVLEPARAFGVAGSPSASAFLIQSVPERRPWHYSHRWLGAPARGTVTNPEVLEHEVLAAHGDGEVRSASLAWGAQVIRATFEPRGPGGVQRAILRWSEPTSAGWGTLSVTEGDGSVRILSRQVGLPAQWKATPWVRLATSDPAGLAPTVLQVEAGVSNSLPVSFSLVVDGPAGYRFSSNWFGSPIRLELPAPVEGDYAARVAVSEAVVSQNLRVHSVPGRAEVTFSTNRVRVRRGEPLELNLERRGDASGTSWVRIRATGAGGPDVPAPRFEQPAALTNVDYRVPEPVIVFPPGSRRQAVPIQFPLAGMFRGNLGLDLNLELLTNAFPGADRACRVVLVENQELGEARVHLEVLGSVSGLGTRLQARVDGRADLAGQLVLEGWPAGGASTGLASAGRPLLEHTFRPERAGQFFLQARFMDRWQQEHRSPVLAMRLAPELIPGAPQLPGTPPRVWKAVPDYDPRAMDLEASEDLRHWEVVRPIWSPAAPGELGLPDTGANRFLRLRLP